MASEITDFNEEELNRKLVAKRRVRGLLIVINFVLFGYLAYQIGANVVNLIKTANQIEGVVPIINKNQKESLEIYKQYINEDKVLDGDFAIYGDKIYFTNGNFNKEDIKTVENLQLIKLEAKKSDTIIRDRLKYENIGNYLSDGVSLFLDKNGTDFLEQGDYLFYHNYVDTSEYGEVVRVRNQLNMKYEMYSSLKTKEGLRVKTTIYAYKNNPALVMNVEYVNVLPDNYYDVVLMGNETNCDVVKQQYEGLKVLVKETMTEKEMFELNANTMIKVIDEDFTNDENTIYSSSLLNDQNLNSDDPFILTNMGYALSRGYDFEFNNEHYQGKLAYIVDVKN